MRKCVFEAGVGWGGGSGRAASGRAARGTAGPQTVCAGVQAAVPSACPRGTGKSRVLVPLSICFMPEEGGALLEGRELSVLISLGFSVKPHFKSYFHCSIWK